jgi:cytochrome P450
MRIAGSHTFGFSIAWILIELDRHPECLKKLLAEIETSNIDDFNTVNSRMPYLNAVFMEIHRLHPPINAVLRTVNHETVLSSSKMPVLLQPGMLIFISLLYMQTSAKYWGSDSSTFRPERWLDMKEINGSLVAFGYGPRSCVSLYDKQKKRQR